MTFDQLQERMRQQRARQAARRSSNERAAPPPVPEIPPSVGMYADAQRDALPLVRLVHAALDAMEVGDMAMCRQYLSTANELHGSAAVDRYLSALT